MIFLFKFSSDIANEKVNELGECNSLNIHVYNITNNMDNNEVY
jgi:hypothetical protein